MTRKESETLSDHARHPPPTPHDGTKALIPSDSPLPNPRIASGPQNYQDSIMLVIKFIDLSFRN